MSEVSVTIVFFSCFVTDGFCCVLQCGIVSKGWDGVCTNPQVHASLPAPPPLTNRLTPALHSPCPSHTLLPPHLSCSLSVIPFVLQCVLVSFCCELIVLLCQVNLTLQDHKGSCSWCISQIGTISNSHQVQ